MREFDIQGAASAKVYSALESARLLPRGYDLAGLLRTAQDLARRLFAAESVEGGLKLDPNTGLPVGISGKITFREPDTSLRDLGFLSVDSLLALANDALRTASHEIWVLLDRLDVAFAETHELERNALRALFRAYRDISDYNAIKIKVFLRSDIWSRITEEGFREASHITKFVILEWNPASLLNLIIRRILSNDALVEELAIDRSVILADFEAQQHLFYRLFPTQVEQGTRKPSTFDWMVSRCADGSGKTAPRELIHLLTSLQETESARLEIGGVVAPGEQLFDRSVFKEALPPVSETRLIQNLLAENPDVRGSVMKLTREKTEQTVESLSSIWALPPSEASDLAQRLVRLGFFQSRGSREQPTYWVPFLYRDALSMSQGLAD